MDRRDALRSGLMMAASGLVASDAGRASVAGTLPGTAAQQSSDVGDAGDQAGKALHQLFADDWAGGWRMYEGGR